MEPIKLTKDNLIELLIDSQQRLELIKRLQAEQGFSPPLNNQYEVLASRCIAAPEQLQAAINAPLGEIPQDDTLINPLIYHPEMPEEVLFELLKQGRCTTALGHRNGPKDLLEKLAAQYKYSEAITTLALDYYGAEDASDESFT